MTIKLHAALATAAFAIALSLSPPASAEHHEWYPSRYGADDTIGAANQLSPEKVVQAARLVKTGKTYPLGIITGRDTPAYPPRQYMMTVLQLSDGTGMTLGDNKATGNDDLLTFWMGIGSQLDGLGHMGINHTYYNGNQASDFVQTTGLTKLGTEHVPPIVSRGVLLDMAAYFGEEMLPEGKAFNSKEIKAAARKAGIKIEAGDVVLFHTGWLNLIGVDNERFGAGQPGIGVDGAEYLAGLGVVAIGADTWALEVLPSEDPKLAFPVHPTLLAKHGVYILENMDTRALAADGVTEFLFVLGQPRFEGSVQAVINPIAIH